MAGPPDSQRHLHTEVVQVAFAAGETWRAVVTADDDHRVVQLAQRLKPLEDQAQRGVERLHFAEVVGKILPHLVHVRQKLRQPALEIVRVDAPQGLAGAFRPLAVHERRSEPVAERLVAIPVIDERVKIAHHLVVKNLLGILDQHATGHALGRHLREAVEHPTAFFIGIFTGTVWRVRGRTRSPDLVRLADVIAGVAQHQRVRRDGGIPLGPLQNRAHAGAEKILAGEQRTAARRARRRGDEGVLEQHPLLSDSVERRRLDDGVRAGTAIDLRVGAGVLAPVVGEREQDVRPLLLGQAGQRQQHSQGKKQDAFFHDDNRPPTVPKRLAKASLLSVSSQR